MKYETFTQSLFQRLGIKKVYKGTKYISYILHLLSEDESSIEMLTKRLYRETAEKYGTSWTCVEKDIRKIISMIWNISENEALLKTILCTESLEKRPTNKDFLFALYQYTKLQEICSEVLADYEIDYICPTTGKVCNTCAKIVKEIIKRYKKELVE